MIHIFIGNDNNMPVFQMKYLMLATLVGIIQISYFLLTEESKKAERLVISEYWSEVMNIRSLINEDIDTKIKISKIENLQKQCLAYKLKECSFFDFSAKYINDGESLWPISTATLWSRDNSFYMRERKINNEIGQKLY